MAKLITIIDDEPQNIELLCDLLQVTGYSTNVATNGKEGVELTKTSKPDLILMDIQMPEMDGLEATRILKTDAATKDIPILALSSYAMKGDKERILAAGCDEYLSKPLVIKELLKMIAEYLSGEGTAQNTRRNTQKGE